GAEVAGAVAAPCVGEGEGEDVAVRPGRGRRPGGARVARPVHDPLLARDPRGARGDARDGEEGALRAGIPPPPRGAAVARVEDPAGLADGPAVAVGGEAGPEEPLPHLARPDRYRGADGGRDEDDEGGCGENADGHAEGLRRRVGVRLASTAAASSSS